MRSATPVILATLLGLVLMMALLWYGPCEPQEERARAAPTSQSFPIEGDRQDGQGAGLSPSPPNSAAAPPHEFAAVEPTEISASDAKHADVGSDSADELAAPSLAIVRSTLAVAIESHLPDLVLSDNELDDLADATLRLRVARARLRSLPKTREQASVRDQTRQDLEEAIVDFTHIVEMSPAEFTRRVQPDVGIDEPTPEGAPVEVLIRTLPRRDAPE